MNTINFFEKKALWKNHFRNILVMYVIIFTFGFSTILVSVFLKRAISLLLLSLFLYNMVGYYTLFFIQQVNIKQDITQTIEQGNISEEDLIVFSIPITLPYQSERDFERIEGDFEYEGKQYEMVKKRLKNDTLYVYCLNNVAQERLKAKLSKHTAAHVGDPAGSNTSKSAEKIIKQIIKDYLSQPADIFSAHLQNSALLTTPTHYLMHVSSSALRIPSPPPKTA